MSLYLFTYLSNLHKNHLARRTAYVVKLKAILIPSYTVLGYRCTGCDFVWAVFGSKKGRSNGTLQETVKSDLHASALLHL